MRALPTTGTRLTATYKKQTYTAEVIVTGTGPEVHVDGIPGQFRSLSAAGAAVTGCATNGNKFWEAEGSEPEVEEKPRYEEQPPNPETPTEAPGAEADRAVLLVWYSNVVQRYFATHTYDNFVILCQWCLADDQKVRERGGAKYGSMKYCSDRCADAAEAYKVKVLQRGQKSTEGSDVDVA